MLSKLIFFDVDGTLVDFNGKMPKSTKSALLALKKAGHILILCTGRSKSELYPWIFDLNWDGYICASGAYVEYNSDILYSTFMNHKTLHIITNYLEQNNGTYIFEGMNHVYEPVQLFAKNHAYIEEWLKQCGKSSGGIEDIFPEISIYQNLSSVECVHKLNFHGISADADTIINDLNSILNTNNLPEIHAIKFNYNNVFSTSGEITIKGISKRYGINLLIEKAALTPSSTIAFGDSLNDYEMLSTVNTGVAMGNACNKLKEIASYVTDSINNDGVYNACRHLNLF